jgi:hypothetical protein
MWSDDDNDLKYAMTGERRTDEPPFWLALLLLTMLGLLLGYVVACMIN